ncbi:MAG: flagellar biosynthesis protein FlgB [Proteobacteria bacterium]|nr:flagellar biosynthesis protein FlgB [Pseudomonadota bacterium]
MERVLDPTPSLLTLAEQRLRWAVQRQEVLAENIANANTPGYAARDLPDFKTLLSGAAGAAVPAVTQPGHLAGTLSDPLRAAPVRPAGRSPDRNTVSTESELSKVAETETTQEFATNIYRKYMSMFRLALGRSQ